MTIINTTLFINGKNVQIRGIIVMEFFTEGTVFNSECRSMRISVFDLMLIEELFDRYFRPVEFGLIDEKFVFEKEDRLIFG